MMSSASTSDVGCARWTSSGNPPGWGIACSSCGVIRFWQWTTRNLAFNGKSTSSSFWISEKSRTRTPNEPSIVKMVRGPRSPQNSERRIVSILREVLLNSCQLNSSPSRKYMAGSCRCGAGQTYLSPRKQRPVYRNCPGARSSAQFSCLAYGRHA